MNYEIFGGFTIPRKPRKHAVADARDRRAFWDDVETERVGLSAAVGCYVFAIRAGGGIVPWYVGRTCSQSFKNECFELHKLRHYDDVISGQRGTPLLYFAARTTPGGKFTASAPTKESQFLESMLIGMALQRNPELKNIVHATFLKRLHVPGLVNPRKGTPPRNVREFSSLFKS